jgi:hypothetical protein
MRNYKFRLYPNKVVETGMKRTLEPYGQPIMACLKRWIRTKAEGSGEVT